MVKKSLLIMLLMALLVPWAAKAQTVTIGTGTSTQNSAPIANYYNYSMAEMIFTADEIGSLDVNTLLSVGFECTTNVSKNYGVTIYMKNIEAAAFTATSDYITLTADDVVFTGTVSPTSGWTVIELPSPFTYDITGNLLIAVNKTSGGYDSNTAIWRYTSTLSSSTYKMLYSQTDGSAYDPTTTLSLSMNYYRPNVQLVFATPATCAKPTLGEAQYIEEDQVSLQWTENGTATDWILEYSTNEDFTNATTLNFSGIPARVVSGLESSTTYYAHIKSDCGGGDQSAWSNTISFTTKQAAVAVGNGWSDDFEGTVNWMMVNSGNNAWTVGSAVNNGGSKSLYITNDGGTSNAYTNSGINIVYATKLLTFETGQYTINFDWKANGEGNYDFVRAWLAPASFEFTAGVLPSGSTSTTSYTSATPDGWIDLGGKMNLSTSWQTQDITANITAGDYNFVFMWANDNSGGTNPPAAIDNIAISRVLCPQPTDLSVTNVTAHEADLSWVSDATTWSVEYADNADFNNSLTENVREEPNFHFTRLTPETTYYVRIKSICDGSESEYSNTKNFTTTIACPVPTGLTCTGVTATSATLRWTSQASGWKIMLNDDESTIIEVRENPYTIERLTAETIYTAKVKAVCGGEDGESEWSSAISFEPTAKTVIGSGTATSSYLPSNTNYDYSYTQQIYTPQELGEAGAFKSIDFYMTSTSAYTRNLDIYMVSTDKNTFEDNSDWISVSATDLVFSGDVAFAGNSWTTITLDNDFNYDGKQNVAIIVDDNTGSYSSRSFSAFSTSTEQSHYYYRDGNNIDPAAPGTNGTVIATKNQIRILKGEPASCPKPVGVTITYNGGNTAEVSWSSDAQAWAMILSKDNGTEFVFSKMVYENPYTLTDLEMATTYAVRLAAECEEDVYSDWTNDVSFTTDLCLPQNQCEITLSLTDSYGDGWNGASLEVVDVETGASLGIFTNTGGKAAETENYTLAVCNGREIQFVWHSGSYDSECSFAIFDTNEEEIISGVPSDLPYNYTVNCSACSKPSNLTTTNVSTTSAVLGWQGSNSSYVLQYRTAAQDMDMNVWNQVGEDVVTTHTFTQYSFDLSDYAEQTGAIAIRHYAVSDMFRLVIDDIEVTNANNEVVLQEGFENGSIPSTWSNIDYDNDGNTWQIASFGSDFQNGNYSVFSESYSNDTYSALTPDNWLVIPNVELGGTLTLYAAGTDNQGYHLENFGVFVTTAPNGLASVPAGEWSEEISLTETTCQLSNLTANTPYEWRVKGICNDEESNWATSSFSTIPEGFKTFVTEGNWDVADNWSPAGVPTITDEVTIAAAANIPSNVVAQAKKVTIDGGSIVIQDGGQLKQGSATLKVTMKKSITGYGAGNENNKANYYFISTPFSGRTQLGYNSSWSHVLHLIEGNYDLYAFDPTSELEWINYETNSDHSAFTSSNNLQGLEDGQGYLYANEADKVLEFTGTAVSSYNVTRNTEYTFDSGSTDEFNGWKLVGNPFTCDTYINYIDADGNVLEADFYTMNTNGDGYDLSSSNVALPPLTGALINYNATGKVQYATEAPSDKRSGMLNMTVTQGRSNVDQARIRFGQGFNLGKMSFRNSSKLYIPQGNKDYAVVYSEGQGEMPVSFKAENNGTYTLSFTNTDVEFSYLHLIDNMTGNDVDLLENPSYSFDAKTTDYASRFKLVFATGSFSDDNFAFYTDGILVINNDGNATLKVYDVTGRMVNSQSINGSCQVNLNAPAGVYMIQLVNGDNTKTQKIVVK